MTISHATCRLCGTPETAEQPGCGLCTAARCRCIGLYSGGDCEACQAYYGTFHQDDNQEGQP